MMDTQRDFKPFQELMDQLSAALGGADFKASDARVQAYWKALKDCSLAEVRANIERIIATATKETAFPRPSSLRSRPPPMSAAPPDASRERAERESIRRWEELRKNDPVQWEILLRVSRASRRLLELGEDDPGYQEIVQEQQRWSALRYAPRAEQEAALRTYLGRT
jgi:ribosomal protein L12E/L44/L45/RPP1/RPP2